VSPESGGDETAAPVGDEAGKSVTLAISEKPAGRYPIYRESGSVSAPLLDQLQKLGFTDRQMRTLARLSPETQEEVYTAVVTMLMSDDPVLEDILGWI
jgi:hypothetical protein